MSKKKKPDPEMIDDENPEWTVEDFRRARPAIEVFTEIWGKKKAEEFIYKGRGRPKKARPKRQMTIRFDADILDAFRAGGAGWQSRMNDALREWLKKHGPRT